MAITVTDSFRARKLIQIGTAAQSPRFVQRCQLAPGGRAVYRYLLRAQHDTEIVILNCGT